MISQSRTIKFGLTTLALAAVLFGCSSPQNAANNASPTESASETAAVPAHWTYEGEEGPSNWAELDPTYVTCADGSAQSPIDIVDPTPTDLLNIAFNYKAGEAGVFNNGHTVEAEPLTEGENYIELDGVKYPFLQFHFHAPSEHKVNGVAYPLEIHFVHKTEDGKIAVVGLLVERGAMNPKWQSFVEDISVATENAEDTTLELDWASLLPSDLTTIRYDGSLTTPGCTEGVKWNVLSNPINMSASQIQAFSAAYPNNSRPVQDLNGRKVKIDSTPEK